MSFKDSPSTPRQRDRAHRGERTRYRTEFEGDTSWHDDRYTADSVDTLRSPLRKRDDLRHKLNSHHKRNQNMSSDTHRETVDDQSEGSNAKRLRYRGKRGSGMHYKKRKENVNSDDWGEGSSIPSHQSGSDTLDSDRKCRTSKKLDMQKPNEKHDKPPKKNYKMDATVLAKRQKMIDYGKNTIGYQCYVEQISKARRDPAHPNTPDKYSKCSRRSWDTQIKIWRKLLHFWDPPELEGSRINNSDLSLEGTSEASASCDEVSESADSTQADNDDDGEIEDPDDNEVTDWAATENNGAVGLADEAATNADGAGTPADDALASNDDDDLADHLMARAVVKTPVKSSRKQSRAAEQDS